MRAVEKLLKSKRLLAHLSRDFAPVAMYQTFCPEDIVLAHLIFSDLVHMEYRDIHMFAIDTGKTSDEVYYAMDKLQTRYGNVLTVYYPDSNELENVDVNHSFGSDSQQLKDEIRLLRPLKRALCERNAWISTSDMRKTMRASKSWISWDETHQLPCFNPLARWTQEEIRNYAKHYGLPLIDTQNERINYADNFDDGSVVDGAVLARHPAAVGQ